MGPPRERDGETKRRLRLGDAGRGFNGAAARTRRRVGVALRRRAGEALLQWGRRANATERRPSPELHARVGGASMGPPRERDGEHAGQCADRYGEGASMGPPRERDGELGVGFGLFLGFEASMGPPRERDGESSNARRSTTTTPWLQWGRRANATESLRGPHARNRRDDASMGPPRERDGEVNRSGPIPELASKGFNGAAARTRRRDQDRLPSRPRRARASMGPPRERDGEHEKPLVLALHGQASMGPPRERDGEEPMAVIRAR